MRQLLTLVALSLVLSAPASLVRADSPADSMPAGLEQCIRDNAASVEKAVPDLTQAVDFLVTDVCAVPIAQEQERQAKVMADKQAARMKAVCASMKASGDTTSSSEDGDLSSPEMCNPAFTDDDLTSVYVTGFGAQSVHQPAGNALAAHLLLDLRLSHSTSGSSH